jgi:AcrR family transcriptional regulator
VGEAQAPARRTQQQRRDATVGKLVDATIATLVELGYARTSVSEICSRAGVSHGGLFRHYDTRLSLVIAAAEEVARRQVAGFSERFGTEVGPETTLRAALVMLRESARAPMNAVWYELLNAARTDQELRDRLEPVARRYYADMDALASTLPYAASFPHENFALGVRLAVHCFDGEALQWNAAPEPGFEAGLLEALVELFEAHELPT